MDIAVLSDIHSNYAALEACINYSLKRGITNFLFLGDYVGDCPYPQRSLQKLYELSEQYYCWFIRGNREEYALDYKANGEQGWIPGSSSGCLLYTYENLTEKDLNFFDKLPNHSYLEFSGLPPIYYCHGSLDSSKERLDKDSEVTKKTLDNLSANILICGHTHVQGTFEYHGKKLINPGSVGVPWYYNGKTQFALLHGTSTEWSEEYIQLEYDRDKVISEFEPSGLSKIAPMWVVLTKVALQTGNDVISKALNRAMELCKAATGEAVWPHIPEEYWEQAAREQGVIF